MRVLQQPGEGEGRGPDSQSLPWFFRATLNDRSTEHPTPMKEDLPWNRYC